MGAVPGGCRAPHASEGNAPAFSRVRGGDPAPHRRRHPRCGVVESTSGRCVRSACSPWCCRTTSRHLPACAREGPDRPAADHPRPLAAAVAVGLRRRVVALAAAHGGVLARVDVDRQAVGVVGPGAGPAPSPVHGDGTAWRHSKEAVTSPGRWRLGPRSPRSACGGSGSGWRTACGTRGLSWPVAALLTINWPSRRLPRQPTWQTVSRRRSPRPTGQSFFQNPRCSSWVFISRGIGFADHWNGASATSIAVTA